MRLMSFFYTWPQILDGSKDVTRRLGWADLKPGDRFQAIQKGQGLKKGEKVVRGPVLECVSNKSEPLFMATGLEVIREGFPHANRDEFVRMFCKHMSTTPDTTINRIEFKRV